MKVIVTITCFLTLISCQSCQPDHLKETDTKLIFLVRHAEKADDGTKDPPLTETGITRSNLLADMLTDAEISHIYSTDYKRTRETAQALSLKTGHEINSYNPGELDSFVKSLKSLKGNILVVGHSNTTPSLANLLIGEDKYEPIDEADYTNLFIISLSGDQSVSTRLHF